MSLSPGERAWLLALMLLWGSLLLGGFFFSQTRPDGTRRMPRWTRVGSSLVLATAAWSWFAFSRGRASPFPLLIAIGMTCGLLGDLFMARLLPVSQHVVWGMGAFGLGHLAYISAMLAFGNRSGLAAAGPRWGAWAAWLLMGALGWYLVVWRGGQPDSLHRAALPYALLLASTAGAATGLALQQRGFLLLALGGALFLISDLVLAARLFNNLYFYLIDDVVWLTYGPAQMLIVYSCATALGMVS